MTKHMNMHIKSCIQSLALVAVMFFGVMMIPSVVGAVGLKDGADTAQSTSQASCLWGIEDSCKQFNADKTPKLDKAGKQVMADGMFKTVTNTLLFIIGAIAVIMLVVGGLRYTVSGGDSNQITSAKNTILYAIVGIIVAALAYAIVNWIVTQFVK